MLQTALLLLLVVRQMKKMHHSLLRVCVAASSVAISGSSLAQYKIYGQSVDRNVFGEIAFQLERRIMDYVFAKCLPDDTVLRSDLGKSRRVYGYTVSRIGELISEEVLDLHNSLTTSFVLVNI